MKHILDTITQALIATTTWDNFFQFLFCALSLVAIRLIAKKNRWGFVCGLLTQPFWYFSTYNHKQWLVFILTFAFTYTWLENIYKYFFKKCPFNFKTTNNLDLEGYCFLIAHYIQKPESDWNTKIVACLCISRERLIPYLAPYKGLSLNDVPEQEQHRVIVAQFLENLK